MATRLYTLVGDMHPPKENRSLISGERSGSSHETSALQLPKDFVLIVGAMKSGTTSLFELLAQHPEIAACKEKEPHFFASSDSGDESAWKKYLQLWRWDENQHTVALEASTSYSKAPWVPDVPIRIASRPSPNFRFIYIMRDPISRIASQVRHSLYEGWGQSLDDGFTEDLLDFSRYAMQIDQYVDVFPRESILLLTLEELRSEPDEVLQRTCRFLGVADDFRFSGKTEVRNAGDFFQVPSWVGRMARSHRTTGLVKRVVPARFHGMLRNAVAKIAGTTTDIGRWELSEDEKAEVLATLSADLRRLRDIYEVDVHRHWAIPESLLEP